MVSKLTLVSDCLDSFGEQWSLDGHAVLMLIFGRDAAGEWKQWLEKTKLEKKITQGSRCIKSWKIPMKR